MGNEGVLGLEVGYGYRSEQLDVDLNVYYTSWTDRQIRQSGDFDGDTFMMMWPSLKMWPSCTAG